MHIKHMHEMIEKLTDCTKSAIENDEVCVGKYPISDVVDMIKDLNEASYYASIVKAMDKAEEEDKEEEKYMLKRFKEEYGDDEGERRFYDNYRYKSSGRFAPKGSGSYMPRSSGRRRGYEEMPYMHMYPEIYGGMTPEEMRDMDLDMNRMYYSGSYGAKSGGSSRGGTSGSMNMGGSGGNVRGYEDGYRDGEMAGRSMQTRDHREGRSGTSRKRYFETKEENKGNSAEEKQKKLKELEGYMRDVADDLSEIVSNASNEEKTMIKAKVQTMLQHL